MIYSSDKWINFIRLKIFNWYQCNLPVAQNPLVHWTSLAQFIADNSQGKENVKPAFMGLRYYFKKNQNNFIIL